MTRKKYGTYFAHQVACCITIFIFSTSLPLRIMECPSSFIFIKDQQRPMEFMKYGEMEESCLSSFWHHIVKCPLYLAWFFVVDHELLQKQHRVSYLFHQPTYAITKTKLKHVYCQSKLCLRKRLSFYTASFLPTKSCRTQKTWVVAFPIWKWVVYLCVVPSGYASIHQQTAKKKKKIMLPKDHIK